MTTLATTERPDTYEETVATISRLAKRDFASHVLRVDGPEEWFCHRPNTGAHCFRVLVRASLVMVAGDAGHGIFRGGEAKGTREYTLSWVCEAVDSPEYLIEKLRPQPAKHFYPDDALDYAREAAADTSRSRAWLKVLREAERLRRGYDLSARTWADLVYCGTGDPEYCSIGLHHGPDSLWLVEALKCFDRLLREQAPAPGAKEEAR